MIKPNIQQLPIKNKRGKEYNDLLKRWTNFYNTPLKNAIAILVERYHFSLPDIAREVFNNELSREAIHENYRTKADK